MKILKTNDIQEFIKYIVIKNNSIKMWEPSSLTKEKFDIIYSKYTPYLIYNDSDVIGGFLLLDQDYSYWNDEDNLDKANYLHKFFILPQYNGQGLSNKILSLIKEISVSNGKDYLRLDCRQSIPKIRSIYENAGFIMIREFNSEYSGAMYLMEYNLNKS